MPKIWTPPHLDLPDDIREKYEIETLRDAELFVKLGPEEYWKAKYKAEKLISSTLSWQIESIRDTLRTL